MSRPKIEIGDKVRFRTDGEIGILNKHSFSESEIARLHTVDGIIGDTVFLNDEEFALHPIALDICNSFEDVAVGDEVEWYFLEYPCVRTVRIVKEDRFQLDDDFGDHNWISKATGYELDTDEPFRILRYHSRAKQEKPLLADAKAGWVCKCRYGGCTQLIDIVETPIIGKNYLFGDGMARYSDGYRSAAKHKSPCDLISCEPLAPAGTAEWAWQMRCLLGKEVIGSNGVIPQSGFTLDEWKLQYYTMPTGWQIYEPEPVATPETPSDATQAPLRGAGETQKPGEEVCQYCNGTGISKIQPSNTSNVACPHCLDKMLLDLHVAGETQSPAEPDYITCSKCGGTGFEIRQEKEGS